MFTYAREEEIGKLYKELEKYQKIGKEESLKERLKNMSFDKEKAIKMIEDLIAELLADKTAQKKRYDIVQRDKKTQAARKKHKKLIQEYHDCLKRAVEIGNSNIIESDFNLNSYTEFNGARGVLRSNLHMASIGLERINRQTSENN